MRGILGLIFGIILLFIVAPGCRPALTEEELGTVIFDVQQIPGADHPYDLPNWEAISPPESENEPGDGA